MGDLHHQTQVRLNQCRARFIVFAGVAAVNLGGKVDFLRFGNKGNLTDVLHIDFHRVVLRRRDRSEFGVFLLFRFPLFLVVVKIERFIFDILVRFLVVEVLGKDIVRRRFRLLLIGRQDRIGHRLGFRNHKIIIIVVAVLLFVRNGVLFRFFGFFRMFLLLGSGGFQLCRLLDRFFLFRFDFLCRSLFCRSFLRLGRRFRFFWKRSFWELPPSFPPSFRKRERGFSSIFFPSVTISFPHDQLF